MTEEPVPKKGLPYGAQVAFGFLLPIGALALGCLGLIVTGGMAGQWSSLGVIISGVAGLFLFLGGVALASKRGWKGFLLGLLLAGALLLLLIGTCFAMLWRLGR